MINNGFDTEMSIQRKMHWLYRRKALFSVPLDQMRHVPNSKSIRSDTNKYPEDNEQMCCNIDEREKCASCGQLFEPGNVKFLVHRQPLHEDCFREYMKKTMRIEI